MRNPAGETRKRKPHVNRLLALLRDACMAHGGQIRNVAYEAEAKETTMPRSNFLLSLMMSMAAAGSDRYEMTESEKADDMQFARKQLTRITGEDHEYDLLAWHECLLHFSRTPLIGILPPKETVAQSYVGIDKEFPGTHEYILDRLDNEERIQVASLARAADSSAT